MEVFQIALSNNRLEQVANDAVTFRYIEGKTGAQKRATLPVDSFIGRFLAHVLPNRFVKVRYYGLLSVGKRRLLAEVRSMLALRQAVPPPPRPAAAPEPLVATPEADVRRCPSCGQPMQLVQTLSPKRQHERRLTQRCSMTLGSYPPVPSRFLVYNGGGMPGYTGNRACLGEQLVTIESLQSQLDAFDQPALYEPHNFQGRAEVIDAIEFEIIDRIDGLLAYPSQPRKLRSLRHAAEQRVRRLQAIDEGVFHDLRSRIRGGCRGEPLRQMIERLVGLPAADNQGQASVGYDRLDRLVTGILDSDALPEPRLHPEPEMVLNQRTPARIIFELIRRANLGPQDCFYDLGCGMGQVTTLVHLLSGAPARGVEFEPAFCEYARARAAALRLTQIEFITADARRADYAEGTIFYMYTPFEGAMLLEVLERLRERSRSGPIRLATYGSCTAIVAQQDWLSAPSPAEPGSERLALFSSHDR